MSIELLLVAESFKVRFDSEIDHGRGVVGKILLQRLRINGCRHFEVIVPRAAR